MSNIGDVLQDKLRVKTTNGTIFVSGIDDVREVASYEDGYADGFDRGEEAIVQQIDGIMDECFTSGEAVRRLRHFIKGFWKERES